MSSPKTHTCVHTHTHTHIDTHRHTHTQRHTHPHTHTHTHTHPGRVSLCLLHLPTLPCWRCVLGLLSDRAAQAHTLTHTYTHTHTHTHTHPGRVSLCLLYLPTLPCCVLGKLPHRAAHKRIRKPHTHIHTRTHTQVVCRCTFCIFRRSPAGAVFLASYPTELLTNEYGNPTYPCVGLAEAALEAALEDTTAVPGMR